MNIKTALLKVGHKAKGKSNVILGIGAVLGLGATVVLVARGQMKADYILAERDKEFDSGIDEASDVEVEVVHSFRENFDLTWQCYIPAAISTGITLFCIIGSNYISMKQIAALSGSLAFMTANRDQLEKAIRDKYGDEALVELKKLLPIRTGVVADTENQKAEIIFEKVVAEETGKGDLLCFEGYSGRWFRSSKQAVQEAMRELQKCIEECEYVSFNDLYDLLGLEKTHFGEEYGWINTEYDSCTESYGDPIRYEINVIFEESKGEDVLFIDIYTYPIENFYEY